MIIDAAKAIPIEAEVARRGGLGLKRMGRELVGPCMRCGGRDRFSISMAKGVWNCRGCGRGGDVIDLVMHLDGVGHRDAVRTLTGMSVRSVQSGQAEHLPIERTKQDNTDKQNTERALRLWNDAESIAGTVAENYLWRRGLNDLPGASVLRLLKGCPFDGGRQICLIALYRDMTTNEPRAIARTAIDSSGNKIGRMTLGSTKGAAIKIDDDTDVELGLVIGEGLETVLAGRQLGFRPAWALGSSGAIKTFPVLSGITALTILVDHDDPDRNGRQAGHGRPGVR
jgi:phage/plasmid primase-like uncharacterized protein